MRLAIMAIALPFSCPVWATEFPVVGGHGFDWLNPDHTQCRRVTEADAKKFKACEFLADGNAFGLQSPYHSCRVSKRSEYFVYGSRAKCVEAFETMRSNAP